MEIVIANMSVCCKERNSFFFDAFIIEDEDSPFPLIKIEGLKFKMDSMGHLEVVNFPEKLENGTCSVTLVPDLCYQIEKRCMRKILELYYEKGVKNEHKD